ncbi:MAG: PemK-like, MazF-like toxin of type toxin-antitoxin system [Verrucomicrobiota bacterium]|jgi:mRNA-degrading endonuclease toxin of MazEF toxin-antitoxin module
MKQWDIVTWTFPEGKHPAVIISHSARVANKPIVNVLLCSSQRAKRQPEVNEVILDEADGLDWPTLCKCDLLYDVDKKELSEPRGTVTPLRRRKVIEKMIACFGWTAV